MTFDELRKRYPVGCDVQLTQDATALGFEKIYGGTRGKVEAYRRRPDLGAQPFFAVRLWLYAKGRRRWCQPSQWEPVPKERP